MDDPGRQRTARRRMVLYSTMTVVFGSGGSTHTLNAAANRFVKIFLRDSQLFCDRTGVCVIAALLTLVSKKREETYVGMH